MHKCFERDLFFTLLTVCVLKQFEEETECETKGFVTVFVARSSQPGDIVMKTVPVLPAMTAVEVCKSSPLCFVSHVLHDSPGQLHYLTGLTIQNFKQFLL